MHSRIRHTVLALLSSVLLTAISARGGHDSSPESDYQLAINGEVPTPIMAGASDLSKLKSYSVKAKDHDGKTSTYKGPLLVDVLKLSGMTFGESVRGPRLATYLLVTCRDNYKVILALPEFDPAFTDKLVIVAGLKDGKPLSETEGPLRLIIQGEKRQARWARQMAALTIVNSGAAQAR